MDDYYEDEYTYDDNDYSIRESDNAFSRSLSYQVIRTVDLHKVREQLINEAMEFLCLSKDETTLVMINYQWNMEKIRDLWYENVDGNKVKCGIGLSNSTLNFFKKEKILSSTKYCLVCFADYDKDTFYFLQCGHNFCNDCWSGHLESKTEDILTMISATCPQQGCPLVVPESIFRKFLCKNSLEIMNKAILKNFTDNNSDLKW